MILNLDYLPDYLSVSYDYGNKQRAKSSKQRVKSNEQRVKSSASSQSNLSSRLSLGNGNLPKKDIISELVLFFIINNNFLN